MMSVSNELIQGLCDAGCSRDEASWIGTLYESGNYDQVLHQMKRQRCILMDQMHESQRKVDRIDLLIRSQEKLMK